VNRTVIGILAHVDAGKTTLSEAMLYRAGTSRKLGRVDRGDTVMDTHALERERGITIFASQAVLPLGEREATLLDTPGHVDFSAETERTLQVLDYAVLVVSASEGVQSHTRTLWRLLALYRIPTFVFVTKMDFGRRSAMELMEELRRELGDGCVDFSAPAAQRAEALAVCREDVLEKFMDTGEVSEADTVSLIRERLVFPCYFGSGLKLDGVDDFLAGLGRYALPRRYPECFGAKVFKITYDEQGNRLTHMKITGGRLSVRDAVFTGQKEEKVQQIRVYSGARFRTEDVLEAGAVGAVLGLGDTENGQGLGTELSGREPVLEPVMEFRVALPADCDARVMLPKLRRLEEEDPLLRISWNAFHGEIRAQIMGGVQAEILRSLIAQRFGVQVELDHGRIVYRETIKNKVEGVGHYEPLRHYAEVHLILEPLPRGRGLVFASSCPENALDRNWQRLVLTHLAEKQHLGVLSGAPITDMKITLAAGRAHQKHTEGGDFRQATYRAVRQGLMQAESVLLEPYCTFRLEVPASQIGRAITDIRARGGTFDAPENQGEIALLRGRAPLSAVSDYGMEILAYTGGTGRFLTEADGYDVCLHQEAVLASCGYRAENDTENPADSVFCARGAGFTVKWDQVHEYMHLESVLARRDADSLPRVNHRNIRLDEKELEALMLREFGPIKRRSYKPAAITAPTKEMEAVEAVPRKTTVIVDGYNVIHGWEDLRALAENDLEAARIRLTETLVNYAAYTRHTVIVVFDAYNVSENKERHEERGGVHIVYTKENETGDAYIERFIHKIGKNDRVRVVTSDALIQISALHAGVLRVPVSEFEREVEEVHAEIAQVLTELGRSPLGSIGEIAEHKKETRSDV